MAEIPPDGRPSQAHMRNKTPWAIAAALIVVGGVLAALVSGGGTGQSTTDSGRAGVTNGPVEAVKTVDAPPPSKGEKVLAAKQLTAGTIVYRAVLSIPAKPGPAEASVPIYMTLYVGQPSPLSKLDRIRLPYPFARNSYISEFRPSANSDKTTASVLLSWFVHRGDRTDQTHYFELTPHGIQIDS